MFSTLKRRLVTAAAAGLLALTALAAPAQADHASAGVDDVRAARTPVTLGDGGWP
ncbi:hypothetical protein [Glycomyces terrestris]|uniref:hypothetical protein n=1 Tax=Glycomyces terrestris TaxID=2493553 RepID=UPI0013151CAE|nr:hypothetical protein [Glycomyces terrestris]